MRELSATELHSYLDTVTEQPLLLDVREPWEFDKARINGSTLIPMRTVPQQLQELKPEKETVVICHHGIRSRMVCQFLENQGFSNLINLNGGVAAWATDVDRQMPTY
ncbi:Rhodanese-like domain protein [hydrothermal vent metagenome]|uniref:Rhodanese-like domain protein n=1 Tax=hydrothermal vent metagenome TaxID=652676 RepID=A0A3B0YF09_9ZZZZ